VSTIHRADKIFSTRVFELTLLLAKLLSLTNDDDEAEHAAVIVVESLNEKILNTVDEEPARASPGKLFFTSKWLTDSSQYQ